MEHEREKAKEEKHERDKHEKNTEKHAKHAKDPVDHERRHKTNKGRVRDAIGRHKDDHHHDDGNRDVGRDDPHGEGLRSHHGHHEGSLRSHASSRRCTSCSPARDRGHAPAEHGRSQAASHSMQDGGWRNAAAAEPHNMPAEGDDSPWWSLYAKEKPEEAARWAELTVSQKTNRRRSFLKKIRWEAEEEEEEAKAKQKG